MPSTFYWHDYETFGTDPARDRPVQFAGIRTDEALNIIGDPLVIYARPHRDYLPNPVACLVTGITPQEAVEKGLPESEFIARIHEEFSQPGTCGVGYNSLRFDDEITRYTLYRNFFDPYAREWKNGNSRWDIIDMVRATNALRPEGIEWPVREDGLPSFKLEDLTTANGIAHEAAHDALSDVHATIAMAKLIRERQPRLYDYVYRHRGKQAVLEQLDIQQMKPMLHVSGMFGAHRHNIALIAPLAVHPVNRNEIICWDLSIDPQMLFDLAPLEIRDLLYTRSEDMPEGRERPGLKSVHANKCPILVTPKMADPETARRLAIDGGLCRAHLAALRDFRASHEGEFGEKIRAIYANRKFDAVDDPDTMLYGGGFFSDNDRSVMDQVRELSPDDLAVTSFVFEDQRLPEMLFRYRARNFPQSLSDEERSAWEEFRFLRLTDPEAGANLCMEEFQAEVEKLLSQEGLAPRDREVLERLLEYADSLLA